MLSSLVKDNLLDDQENREKIQKVLNKIYELLTNKKSKKDEALNLLDDLIYEKINLEEIPQSLNLQGCLIMTFSKFWMIIILSSLNQMKFKGTKSYMNYLCSIPLIHSSPTNKIKCPFIYDIIVDKIDVNEDIDELYKPSEQINEDTVEEERENANEECKIIETERKSV